jgi:hypothetical protein
MVQLSATGCSCCYFESQSSEFCRHNPLCCFSKSVYCCKRIFRYRLSPETFGYAIVNANWENMNIAYINNTGVNTDRVLYVLQNELLKLKSWASFASV